METTLTRPSSNPREERTQRKLDFISRNLNARVMAVDNPETHEMINVLQQFDRFMTAWRRQIGRSITFSQGEELFKEVEKLMEQQKEAVQNFCEAVNVQYREPRRRAERENQATTPATVKEVKEG